MRNIFLFIRSYFNFLVFLLLQVFCLYFISSYSKYHEAAFGNVTNRVTGKLNDRYQGITKYFGLSKTNQQLAAANEDLLNRLSLDQELKDIPPLILSDSLLMDSVKRVRKLSFHCAPVISNSVSAENNFLVLSLGSKAGLQSGMGVVDPQRGVVGIITETTGDYSVVMSLLHRDSRISGKLLKGGETGTLTWDGKEANVITLNNIPKSARVAKGDTIITSGFSTAFPRGMFVGRVIAVLKEKSTSNFRIKIKTSADFHDLQYVYVIDNVHRAPVDAILKKLEKQS
jgi:rod shape-determining protein MreC